MFRRAANRSALDFALVIPPLVLALALAGLFLATRPVFTIDTQQLVAGARQAHACLADDTLTRCGLHGAESAVAPFPLLQYPLAYLFERGGAGNQTTIQLLGAVNLLAVLALACMTWLVTTRLGRRALAPLAVAVIVFSPLLFYAHAGFGEALAALAVALAATAVILRWPPVLVVICFALAGITKETGPPFLLAIALIGLYGAGPRPRRADLLAVGAGLLAAVAINAGFNEFRFGTPTNQDYARAVFRMPSELRAEYFAGLFTSPNAGLLTFWPAALALIGVGVVTGLRGASSLGRALRRPEAWLAFLLLALVAAFASWYSPFGGVAWGPRLLVPWIPALVLLSIALRGAELEAAVRWLARSPLRLALAALLFTAFAVPQVLGPVDAAGYDHRTLQVSAEEVWLAPNLPTQECPAFFDVKKDSQAYYDCLHRMTWRTKPLALVRAYGALGQAPVFLYALLTVGALGSALGLMARRKTSTSARVD